MSDKQSFKSETGNESPSDTDETPGRGESGRRGHADDGHALRNDLVLLGDALDLITLSQGYHSPAVPPLLRTLIRDIRKLEETPKTEATPDATDIGSHVAAAADRAVSAPEVQEAQAADEMEATGGDAAAGAETEAASNADEMSALQDRVQSTDEKLAALTGAVGQLIAVLQRNASSGARGGAERRHALRIPGVNAKVIVHDRSYDVVNWSKSGFLIKTRDTDRFSRRGFDYHFVLELPDEVIEFQGRATPVRIERETLAAEFSDLDKATAEKMAAVADALGAGS